jgi:hypothetical protein
MSEKWDLHMEAQQATEELIREVRNSDDPFQTIFKVKDTLMKFYEKGVQDTLKDNLPPKPMDKAEWLKVAQEVVSKAEERSKKVLTDALVGVMKPEKHQKKIDALQEEIAKENYRMYTPVIDMLAEGTEFFWRMSNVLCWARPDQHDSSQRASDEWAEKMRGLLNKKLAYAERNTCPIQIRITYEGKKLVETYGENK